MTQIHEQASPRTAVDEFHLQQGTTPGQEHYDGSTVHEPDDTLAQAPERLSPGDEMMVAVSRMAVKHSISDAIDGVDIYPHRNKYGNLIGVQDRSDPSSFSDYRFAMQTGLDREIHPGAEYNQEAQQRADALKAMRDAVTGHALSSMRHTPEGATPAIDWRITAESLLQESRQVETDAEKHARLVGAVMAVQLAESDDDRIDFVRKVYDEGMEKDMAAACRDSELLILHDAPGAAWGKGDHRDFVVHPIKSYAPVFEVTDYGRITNYLDHMPKGAGAASAKEAAAAGEELPSAKKMQKELTDKDVLAEGADRSRQQAEQVSLSGEKVGGSLLDAYKIERFALQNKFIRDQFKALFGESTESLTDSAFARELVELRSMPDLVITEAEIRGHEAYSDTGMKPANAEERIAFAASRLTSQVSRAFERLSAPIVEKYSLDGVDLSDPSKLTEEQRVSWRFREVLKQLRQHNALAQFACFDAFAARRDQELVSDLPANHEVWSTAEDGAALPASASDAIAEVLIGALGMEKRGEPRATPEELRDLLQGDRRRLLALATHNIAEFGAATSTSLFTEAGVTRNANGELEMKAISNVPPKESLDLYAAITLGCPALREIHASRKLLSAEQRIAHGSSNFIDHGIAAVINEAYALGLFDMKIYTAAFQAQPRPAINLD